MAPTKDKKDKKDDLPKVNTVIDDGEVKPEEMKPPVVAKVEPKKAPPKPAEKKPERTGLLKVTARQYAQAKGIRWERAAGFLHWATKTHGAGHLLTVPEWTKVHAGFDSTPVGRK